MSPKKRLSKKKTVIKIKKVQFTQQPSRRDSSLEEDFTNRNALLELKRQKEQRLKKQFVGMKDYISNKKRRATGEFFHEKINKQKKIAQQNYKNLKNQKVGKHMNDELSNNFSAQLNRKFQREKQQYKLKNDRSYRKQYNNRTDRRVTTLKAKLGCAGGKSNKSSRFFSGFGDTFKGVNTFFDMSKIFKQEVVLNKKPSAKQKRQQKAKSQRDPRQYMSEEDQYNQLFTTQPNNPLMIVEENENLADIQEQIESINNKIKKKKTSKLIEYQQEKELTEQIKILSHLDQHREPHKKVDHPAFSRKNSLEFFRSIDQELFNRPTKEEMRIDPLKLDGFQFELQTNFLNMGLKEKFKRKKKELTPQQQQQRQLESYQRRAKQVMLMLNKTTRMMHTTSKKGMKKKKDFEEIIKANDKIKSKDQMFKESFNKRQGFQSYKTKSFNKGRTLGSRKKKNLDHMLAFVMQGKDRDKVTGIKFKTQRSKELVGKLQSNFIKEKKPKTSHQTDRMKNQGVFGSIIAQAIESKQKEMNSQKRVSKTSHDSREKQQKIQNYSTLQYYSQESQHSQGSLSTQSKRSIFTCDSPLKRLRSKLRSSQKQVRPFSRQYWQNKLLNITEQCEDEKLDNKRTGKAMKRIQTASQNEFSQNFEWFYKIGDSESQKYSALELSHEDKEKMHSNKMLKQTLDILLETQKIFKRNQHRKKLLKQYFNK